MKRGVGGRVGTKGRCCEYFCCIRARDVQESGIVMKKRGGRADGVNAAGCSYVPVALRCGRGIGEAVYLGGGECVYS